MLSYKTFFNVYAGEKPEDVIQAIYADAKSGDESMTYDVWWQYQKDLWRAKYGKTVPDMHEPEAAQKMIDVLVSVGALKKAETSPPAPGSRFVTGAR